MPEIPFKSQTFLNSWSEDCIERGRLIGLSDFAGNYWKRERQWVVVGVITP